MDQRYYDHIGGYMLHSFLKYAPKHFTLHFYAENITSELPVQSNLQVYDWNVVCKPEWDKFAGKTTDNNAKKFGKKGWASIHAWENIEADRLVWLDADLLFFKEFDESVLEITLPRKKLIGLFDHNYLAAERNIEITTPSAETGYVILNGRHSQFKNFVAEYRRLYELDEKPAELASWWDNQICMLAANKFEEDVFDLSSLRFEGSKTQTPLNHSPLAEYFGHQKGKSKKRLSEEYFKEKTGI